MKNLKVSLILLSWIMLMVAQPGRSISRQHGSMVIVTRALAGRNANVENLLAALKMSGDLGPGLLPSEIFVAPNTPGLLPSPLLRLFRHGRGSKVVGTHEVAGPFFLFRRADTAGIFWDQYHAWVSPSDPRGYGHYVRDPKGVSFLWKKAWLILRGDNDSLIIYGKNGPVEVQISSAPGRGEQDILPALFKLCPKLANPPWNGSAGAGRIYFYRGKEKVGSAAPIGVSLNGMFIGYLTGGNSYFYTDEPAGNYKIGWLIDYHSSRVSPLGLISDIGRNAVNFKQAMAFDLAPGQTKFIRLRVHFGLAHPKVKVSAANERSASAIIKHPSNTPLTSATP